MGYAVSTLIVALVHVSILWVDNLCTDQFLIIPCRTLENCYASKGWFCYEGTQIVCYEEECFCQLIEVLNETTTTIATLTSTTEKRNVQLTTLIAINNRKAVDIEKEEQKELLLLENLDQTISTIKIPEITTEDTQLTTNLVKYKSEIKEREEQSELPSTELNKITTTTTTTISETTTEDTNAFTTMIETDNSKSENKEDAKQSEISEIINQTTTAIPETTREDIHFKLTSMIHKNNNNTEDTKINNEKEEQDEMMTSNVLEPQHSVLLHGELNCTTPKDCIGQGGVCNEGWRVICKHKICRCSGRMSQKKRSKKINKTLGLHHGDDPVLQHGELSCSTPKDCIGQGGVCSEGWRVICKHKICRCSDQKLQKKRKKKFNRTPYNHYSRPRITSTYHFQYNIA